MITKLINLVSVLFLLANPAWAFGSTGCDSSVVLLEHMDGASASATFSQDTQCFGTSVKAITAVGNAQKSLNTKFGPTSLIVDGTGDYLSLADNADWSYGTGDFTIDFWVKRGTIGSTQGLVCQGDNATLANSSVNTWFNATDTILFKIYFDGANAVEMNSTGTITDTTTWHHIAFVRSGNLYSIFIDGVRDGGATQAGTINNSNSILVIGTGPSDDGNELNGRMDEVRISKGVARWPTTASFTPPTSSYCSGCEMFTAV